MTVEKEVAPIKIPSQRKDTVKLIKREINNQSFFKRLCGRRVFKLKVSVGVSPPPKRQRPSVLTPSPITALLQRYLHFKKQPNLGLVRT